MKVVKVVFATAAIIALAFAASAQEPASDELIRPAVGYIPALLNGAGAGTAVNNYLVEENAVPLSASRLEPIISDWVGDVMARELVDAAIAAAEEEQRIDRTTTQPFRVVALEAFTAGGGYDWEAITREHGAVAGVMRVSRPAVAGNHGVVRYEFAARDPEKSWAAYRLFTRDHHGRWTSPRGTMGSVEH